MTQSPAATLARTTQPLAATLARTVRVHSPQSRHTLGLSLHPKSRAWLGPTVGLAMCGVSGVQVWGQVWGRTSLLAQLSDMVKVTREAHKGKITRGAHKGEGHKGTHEK
eukprot:356965-Chlamydomonas_euryale.AAC.1